jgi:uncharacterized membrane protein
MEFLMSMVPVAELRFALPWAVHNDIEPVLAYVIAVLGNMTPVPFILLLIEQIFDRLKKYKWWQGKIEFLEKRADSKGEMVRKYSLIGLCLLVAVPLPGTGAWTGSLVAALMKIKRRLAVPVIFAGVMIAGLIVLFFYSGITFILS